MNQKLKTQQSLLDGFMLSHSDEALCAVWDYSASPYALGDTLTWSMLSGIETLKSGKKKFDVCVIANRKNPCCSLQRYITPDNYHRFLLDVLPAFFVNPMLRDFHLYQDRESLEQEVFYKYISKQVMFPSFNEHIAGFRKAYGLYNSHKNINEFYTAHGFIPRLKVPLIYKTWAQNFLKNYNPQSFFVCVHLRNRGVHTDQTLAELYRDGDFDMWLEFFDIIMESHPDVMFIVLGRPMEWPREYLRKNNLLILKTLGYGLMEELAMIQESDLFMATNSGPGVMAIFGENPYVLYQPDKNAEYTAQLYGIVKGESMLPFAAEHQTIKWMTPNIDTLISTFEEKYSAIKDQQNWH